MLHALVSILGRTQDQQTTSFFLLDKAYALVRSLNWEDEFDEKEGLLAAIAFLSWNCCRRYRSYPETEQWERRVVEHVRAQTPARDLLTLEPSELSVEVLGRFLTDPAVLLAVWQGLDERANHSPEAVLRSASAIFAWLTSRRPAIASDAETITYFEGRVALTAAIASSQLGRERHWEAWSAKARLSLSSVMGADPYLAMIDLNHLARLYLRRHFSYVADRIDSVIERCRLLSMRTQELKAKFLRATNLKEFGENPSQTLSVLRDVYREAVREGNAILAGSLASSLAQMYAKVGHKGLADCYATIGVRLARRVACPWVEAYAVSTWGELLRDRGEYLDAVNAYRAGAQVYAKSSMHPFVAYTRVIIAETLLIAGREDEAIGELLMALPIIERESLTDEAEASVWLMRQAIKQRGMSPTMVREFREQIVLSRWEKSQ